MHSQPPATPRPTPVLLAPLLQEIQVADCEGGGEGEGGINRELGSHPSTQAPRILRIVLVGMTMSSLWCGDARGASVDDWTAGVSPGGQEC